MSKIASQLAAMCCPQLCEHFYSVLCSETNGGLGRKAPAKALVGLSGDAQGTHNGT